MAVNISARHHYSLYSEAAVNWPPTKVPLNVPLYLTSMLNFLKLNK